jgi:formamidopyrimidine-DNA glycosylase
MGDYQEMPEMPEVETLARKLRATIIGKRVVEVRLSGLPLRKPIADSFALKLQSRTIHGIVRRGKYLIVEMEPKAYWVIHLGMTGRILFHAQKSAATRHTHAVVRFSDSTELEYRDHRRFGLLAAYEVRRLGLIPEIRALGIDPLRSCFNDQWLWPLLQKSEQEIKAFLLDQRKVAGLGNIYACESLFLARIHPTRRCFTLDSSETKRLTSAIKDVLKAAIRHNGTTFSDFMDSDGKAGDNQNYLLVFQREGRDCYCCRAPIQRMRQSNRSSFYCSQCQV